MGVGLERPSEWMVSRSHCHHRRRQLERRKQERPSRFCRHDHLLAVDYQAVVCHYVPSSLLALSYAASVLLSYALWIGAPHPTSRATLLLTVILSGLLSATPALLPLRALSSQLLGQMDSASISTRPSHH